MFWLMVVVIAVVVFGIAAVAAGRGGTLAPAGQVREPLPSGLPVGAAELAAVRFEVVLRGYRMETVDAVLDRVGEELAARDARITELERDREHGLGASRPE